MNPRSADLVRIQQLFQRPAFEAELQRRRSPLLTMFPDAGPLRRELYAKHTEFFRAGAQYKQRLFMAANRVGKTVAGAFETACHLTGQYPSWWEGRRFEKATDGWACGTTSQTTRDVVESVLLGRSGCLGMIPADAVLRTVAGRGISGSVETVLVRHVSGKDSKLGFKTYEQGRRSFEGEAKDFIWCDEEPPLDVYTEMLYRLLTTKGLAWTTFTPLLGMSEMVTQFLEVESEESCNSKYVVQAGWKDVPHLDAEEQRKLVANTPPYQIKARTEGEPTLGAGAIYPIDESDITVPYRALPEDWPRAFGMDVGWNRTAAVWGAKEPASGVVYLYSEHYQGQGEPASHAQAIRGRGDWIPGVIDPACLGSSQIDGRTLMQLYSKLGLHLSPAENAVEAGITEVWNLLVSGRLKVMESLSNWLREFRKYHRDDKGSGKIVKRDDHLMDATRYLVISGRTHMRAKPQPRPPQPHVRLSPWS
ncbi:MAG: terminase family protein [Bryobacteraceae bacterium]